MTGMVDSIRGRLLLLAAVWLTAALLGAWAVIGGVLENFVAGRFDADASAIADTLVAGVQVNDSGHVYLAVEPADPRYSLPLSGWFWQVNQGSTLVARSQSLFDMRLNPAKASVASGSGTGPTGEPLRVLVRQFTAPSDATLTVTVTAPQADIDDAFSIVKRPLALSLVALGLGLAAASFVQVSAGLSSLTMLGRRIRAVRQGKAASVPLPRVKELRPVVAELNALLDRNATVLARSRDHLGNLAHSLRTPLSALSNSLGPDDPRQALIDRMERQIGWHLRRARAAGAANRPRGLVTPVHEVIDDILLVLRHPLNDRGLTVDTVCNADVTFAGDRQDLEEMIGNLLENASKWAATRIRIEAANEANDGAGQLTIRIADDGPGLAEDTHALALLRGARLDEAGAAGHGLGLAIVHDLANLNGGRLQLGRAALGGLLVELTLPG